MNKMHFNSYLKKYIISLCDFNRFDINKIYKLSFDEPRLKDPILLFIAIEGLQDKYHLNESDYKLVNDLINSNFNYDLFERNSFKKIYVSYLNKINVNVYDCDTKVKIRDEILSIKQKKGISNYYIYNTLKLNPGNTNAFLRNGDIKKLSLNDSIKILRLVMEF